MEHALGRLEGVSAVSVDLQAGRATITPKSGARIEPRAVFDAIAHAGFRPEAVTVEATGTVKRIDGVARLFLPGQPDPWLGLPEPAPEDGPAKVSVRLMPHDVGR